MYVACACWKTKDHLVLVGQPLSVCVGQSAVLDSRCLVVLQELLHAGGAQAVLPIDGGAAVDLSQLRVPLLQEHLVGGGVGPSVRGSSSRATGRLKIVPAAG